MSEKLKDEVLNLAIKTAWLNPHIDRQFTYKPNRLTPDNGVMRVLRDSIHEFFMPTNDDKFVVYEMGIVDPSLVGITQWINSWVRLDHVAIRERMTVSLYINHRILPMSTIYVRRTKGNKLLFAIKSIPNRDLLRSDHSLYIRFYSNVWFASTGGSDKVAIKTESIIAKNSEEVAALLAKRNADMALPYGTTYLYHNGFYVDKLLVNEVKIGDSLEYIFDGSGVGHYDMPIRNLDFYVSDLDKKRKYLLLAPENIGGNEILFYDDVDFYICSTEEDSLGNDRTVGVYYNRLKFSDLRMLTRKDYAIDANRISKIILQQGTRLNLANAFIRVVYRNASNSKSPPKDGNLTDDLFILPEQLRKQLMVGTRAVIEKWNAVNLEKSPYIKWMGATRHDINYVNLSGVMSWHGMYDVTEKAVFEGTKVRIPPMMSEGGLYYSFNNEGKLIKVFTLTPEEGKQKFLSVGDNNKKGFFVPGIQAFFPADLDLPSRINGEVASPYYEEHYFRVTGGAWTLAQEGEDYTLSTDGKGTVIWLPKHASSDRIKRHAGMYIRRSLEISPADLVNEISFFKDSALPPSKLRMGMVDVWVNGKACVPGLDFFVDLDKFKLRIFNREYYDIGDTKINIEILCRGLPSTPVDGRIGFVQHGLVGYDEKYDMAPYRNKDIYVEGERALVEEVKFSETRNKDGDYKAFREGAPYLIKNVMGTAPYASLDKIVETRSQSIADEKKISDYLSSIFPEEKIDRPVIIPKKHHVVSLLLHTLINDIDRGKLDILYDELSDVAVDFALKPYRELIHIDVNSLDIDWDFVTVYPTGRTTITAVSSKEYSFLRAVNRLYLKGRVQLSAHLRII